MNPEEALQYKNVGNVLSYFRTVHTFIFDVDGVLTNGELLITEKGKLLRTMNVRDGYAMKKAIDEGYKVIIITGGNSPGTIERLKALGVTEIAYGAKNKMKYYETYIDKYNLDEDGILYMGDDIPDYQVMRRAGLACCPKDAAPEIYELAKYVSPYKGGEGCVRDVIEKVLKLHGVWF
ncbi:MAG TPA: 3-deoxy-D-manno-octulosonate 8-phosphate phosphatase [Bacteroidetes bacterium]|nr:3-deoxy-D-manno-octulosonate 8-phosphate phosphatase [Bacteroidota bacterium]